MIRQLPGINLSSYRATEVGFLPPGCPEFAEEFAKPMVDGPRDWAFRNRYVLVKGVDPCAHGLLGVRCPNPVGTCADKSRWADHLRTWAPWDNPHGVFLLSHTYDAETLPDAARYAEAHGLERLCDPEMLHFMGDDWYGAGTTPVRMSFRLSSQYLCPLIEELIVLFRCWPVSWPDDDDVEIDL